MFDQLANEMFLVLPLLCLAVGALVVMMLDVFSGSATLKGVVTAVVLVA